MPAPGDNDARRGRFDAVFAETFAEVRAYVARRADPGTVDDVVSETFLVAWRRLESVPADPLPWLLGVARRVLANQRRADGRRAKLVEALGGLLHGTHAPEPRSEVFGLLGDAINTLSTREREAVLLVAWEGLAPSRAAVVVGCDPAAFRARLSRARRRLAARLGEPEISPVRQPAEEAR